MLEAPSLVLGPVGSIDITPPIRRNLRIPTSDRDWTQPPICYIPLKLNAIAQLRGFGGVSSRLEAPGVAPGVALPGVAGSQLARDGPTTSGDPGCCCRFERPTQVSTRRTGSFHRGPARAGHRSRAHPLRFRRRAVTTQSLNRGLRLAAVARGRARLETRQMATQVHSWLGLVVFLVGMIAGWVYLRLHHRAPESGDTWNWLPSSPWLARLRSSPCSSPRPRTSKNSFGD